MNVLVVDHDPNYLTGLLAYVLKENFDARIVSFTDPMMAGKFAANNKVGKLICETESKRISGYELAQIVKYWNPDVEIVFVADGENAYTQAQALGIAACVLPRSSLLPEQGAPRTGKNAAEAPLRRKRRK